MENPESQQEKTRLEESRDAIDAAAVRIEEEFNRTANSWLACFGSRAFIVETYLSSSKLEAMLPPERYELALRRMEDLKERLYELKQQYPEKDTVPPDNIKEDLLRKLDILRENE